MARSFPGPNQLRQNFWWIAIFLILFYFPLTDDENSVVRRQCSFETVEWTISTRWEGTGHVPFRWMKLQIILLIWKIRVFFGKKIDWYSEINKSNSDDNMPSNKFNPIFCCWINWFKTVSLNCDWERWNFILSHLNDYSKHHSLFYFFCLFQTLRQLVF